MAGRVRSSTDLTSAAKDLTLSASDITLSAKDLTLSAKDLALPPEISLGISLSAIFTWRIG